MSRTLMFRWPVELVPVLRFYAGYYHIDLLAATRVLLRCAAQGLEEIDAAAAEGTYRRRNPHQRGRGAGSVQCRIRITLPVDSVLHEDVSRDARIHGMPRSEYIEWALVEELNKPRIAFENFRDAYRRGAQVCTRN